MEIRHHSCVRYLDLQHV